MTEQAGNGTLAELLRARFGDQLQRVGEERGETTIEVSAENLLTVCAALRDEEALRFSLFTDVCGVDYLGYGEAEWDTTNVTSEGFSRGVDGRAQGRFAWEDRPGTDPDGAAKHGVPTPRRFASVIHLLSLEHNRRVRIRTWCESDDYPTVPSITGLWSGANWFERESFDLFGIIYEGHPDLRRILTDYGFVGHPFRKDFPLIGNVEVRYDPEAGRVIYEPVSSVQPRILVPRVIRDNSALEQGRAEEADHWWEK